MKTVSQTMTDMRREMKNLRIAIKNIEPTNKSINAVELSSASEIVGSAKHVNVYLFSRSK